MVNQKTLQTIKDDLNSTLTKAKGIGNYTFKWYKHHVKAIGGFDEFVDWMKKVIDACDLDGAGTILDLGCGYGEHAYVLSRLGNKVIAVEPRKVYLSVMKALSERKGDKILFMVGDAMNLGLKDSSVDVVYLNETISHMRDFEGSMKEIRRVLKPKGRIVVMDTNRHTYQSWQTMNVICPKTDKTFYVPVRKRTIKNLFDKAGIDCSEARLCSLAEKTRGWTNSDIREHLLSDDGFKAPYPCVDPRSGQYMENLYTPGEVMRILESYGFSCKEIVTQPPPKLHWLPDCVSYWWKCPGKFIIVGDLWRPE